MTEINSNITIEEAEQLAEVMTAEHEAYIVNDEITAHIVNDEITAHIINDEITAHVIDDEIEAHKINAELSQVAETFDALEADGVDLPAMSPEDYEQKAQAKKLEDIMANYMSSKANHIPGKEFKYSDVTFTVQAHPHQGMWTRNEKKVISNPNHNNSVRRKLAKNPTKYNVTL